MARSRELLRAELEDLLSENAELRAKCKELEGHLVTVAATLEENITLLIERNEAAERESRVLEGPIKRREALLIETKTLLSDLCHCGLDVESTDHLNARFYTELFDGVLPQNIEGGDQFHPIVYRIVRELSYFKGCDSNEAFMAKCVELVSRIAQMNESRDRNGSGSDEEDYEAKLEQEQIAFQRHFAHRTVKTQDLLNEQALLEWRIDRAKEAEAQAGREYGVGGSGLSSNSKRSLFLSRERIRSHDISGGRLAMHNRGHNCQEIPRMVV
jgi:hypothetical protein